MEAPSAELAWEILADADLDAEALPWKDWGADRYLFELQGVENKPKSAKVTPEYQRIIDADAEKEKAHAEQLANRSRVRVRRRARTQHRRR